MLEAAAAHRLKRKQSQATLPFHTQPPTVKLKLSFSFFLKDRNRLKFPWFDRHQHEGWAGGTQEQHLPPYTHILTSLYREWYSQPHTHFFFFWSLISFTLCHLMSPSPIHSFCPVIQLTEHIFLPCFKKQQQKNMHLFV